MTERRNLLASITNTIKDYRAGEIAEPTPDHMLTDGLASLMKTSKFRCCVNWITYLRLTYVSKEKGITVT